MDEHKKLDKGTLLFRDYAYEAKGIRKKIYELHEVVKDLNEKVIGFASEGSLAELKDRVQVLERYLVAMEGRVFALTKAEHNDLP